jgi:Protein of unknown function (DUF2946)
MKRFRKQVKQGVRLALFALVVQLALSFGHFHRLALQAAPVSRSGATQSDIADTGNDSAGREASQQPSAPSHDPDQQPADNCTICTVVAMANAVLQSPPPLLLLPQALEFLYLATDAEFVHLKSVGDAVQPHAPPAS